MTIHDDKVRGLMAHIRLSNDISSEERSVLLGILEDSLDEPGRTEEQEDEGEEDQHPTKCQCRECLLRWADAWADAIDEGRI